MMGRFGYFAFLLFSLNAAAADLAKLTYSPECIFTAVAKRMQVAPSDILPFPKIHFESQTTLKEFQDAVEPQWGFRPDVILNVYIIATNEIYLIDDATYYRKNNRFIDDSMAHELVHYVQVKYQNLDLTQWGDVLESDAVSVQTWLRETFMETGKSPCSE
jgi:hypothetical protein